MIRREGEDRPPGRQKLDRLVMEGARTGDVEIGESHRMELLQFMGGFDMRHVPYKGPAPAAQDVLSGQVAMLFGGATASTPIIRSGKLNGIAITSKTRGRMLPEVPTVAEVLPGFQVLGWYAFFGPAAMPRELVRKVNADSNTIVKRPDFQDRIYKDNLDPVGGTPREFDQRLRAEYARWGDLIRKAGIKVQE